MSTRRFLLNPSSTQPLLFLHTTLSHFSKGSLKLHLWSLRLRSYSDVNALNILYCPHCSFIISCNSPLINAPAGRLPPCCQSKTSKSQTSIRYMPVTLRPVGSWYPHETAASLTVTFKALHGLTWAASSLVLFPRTLHTSNTGCFGSTRHHTHSHPCAFACAAPPHLGDSSSSQPPPSPPVPFYLLLIY